MSLTAVVLLGSLTVLPVNVSSRSGDCITAPHDPVRVRRLPGVAATSSKPRNPFEDYLPHCTAPSDGGSTGGRKNQEPQRGRALR